MALVLLLLAAWIAMNVAPLALAVVLDRRRDPEGPRHSPSRGAERVVRWPYL